MLRNEADGLIRQYNMQSLLKDVDQRHEFWDYTVENGVTVLNFAWDLLIKFKPVFAAKLWVIILSLCVDPAALEALPSWERFKAREWSKFAFIEDILKDYRKKWLEFDQNLMIYP
jgi:hypothetical protein